MAPAVPDTPTQRRGRWRFEAGKAGYGERPHRPGLEGANGLFCPSELGRPSAGATREGTLPVRPFDALLIDFYGTIAAGDRQAVHAACRTIVESCDLEVTAESLAVTWGERFFEVVEHSNHEAFRTLYECELSSLRDTLTRFGYEGDPAPFVVELEDYWRNPPVHADALGALEQVRVPVCCVSNADTTPLLKAVQKLGFCFDVVISSEQARCYKPDPAIFQKALDVLEVAPGRALHVGDSLHSDIGGAAKLGIAAAWLCREDRIHDIGNTEPWRTIRSLTEIHQLLS